MEQVKADILSFMATMNLDEGHGFPVRPFSQRILNYTPPQRDAIEPAFDALIAEGVLESRDGGHFLTKKGFERLYPQKESAVVNFVKEDILDFLRQRKARAGNVFAVQPFWQQRVFNYNPKQKSAVDKAVAELVADGVLEEKKGSYFLTEPGYQGLY